MFITGFVGQPTTTGTYFRNIDGLLRLISQQRVTDLEAAVAYASWSGVEYLKQELTAGGLLGRWDRIRKRMLVGIDWCRSDPGAFEQLVGLGVDLRIFDGDRVATRDGCVPYVPWHPKRFAVKGAGIKGALTGSGNLSRNGLSLGHEAGTLLIVSRPTNSAERQAMRNLEEAERWFDDHWKSASPIARILSNYRMQHRRTQRVMGGVTDDASAPSDRVGRLRGLTAEQLRALLSAENYWVEAGTLSKNLGPNSPGNQLMTSAMTRTFFGATADDVVKNTTVCRVILQHPNHAELEVEVSVRYSDNSMDVIGLPKPQSPWPASYDGMTLKFQKIAQGKSRLFVLEVRDPASANEWRNSSAGQQTEYTMQSGRRWGVF
ncbi:hypothetical protein ACFTZB_16115 [Rhodococcus sp. NPDC057014]|uniref:hypothetical protein n=1 Tax=Rhodococcus sp. NPDC057014 TaxID=3346000 RepID=UPI00363A39ED